MAPHRRGQRSEVLGPVGPAIGEPDAVAELYRHQRGAAHDEERGLPVPQPQQERDAEQQGAGEHGERRPGEVRIEGDLGGLHRRERWKKRQRGRDAGE